MNATHSPTLDPFRSYLDANLDALTSRPGDSIRPVVTLSREAGAGGHSVAELVARNMEKTMKLKPASWSVFDENLADVVLESHQLPKRLAEYMTENSMNHVRGMIEEFIGLHPSQWTLVQHTAETMLYLAELGNVVLIGRGANVVTRRMEHAFHVRLVGSIRQRTHRLMELYGIGSKEAAEMLKSRDAGRRSYMQTHYLKDVDDAHEYHLIVNTDRTSYEDTARIITNELVHRFGRTLAQAA